MEKACRLIYSICSTFLLLIYFTVLAVFTVEKEVCTFQLTDISRGKIKWFQIIQHSVFCYVTLKDNSGGFYVKEKMMTTIFTFLKRRNYKHNCQVGYSGMSSVLIVVKYACFLES